MMSAVTNLCAGISTMTVSGIPIRYEKQVVASHSIVCRQKGEYIGSTWKENAKQIL